ncbi:MAG: hypothetical protein ABL929_10470 [Ferruginibacter sp.]
MNKINFKQYILQLKKLKAKEIIHLILVGLSLTFLFSVLGFGFILTATKEAFGESVLLKYLVYMLPIFLFLFLVNTLFKKFNDGNINFKNSILVFLFIVAVASALLKLKISKPIFILQQDYIAYSVVKEQVTDGVVQKGTGLYADKEIGEIPLHTVIENSVISRTDKDEMPVSNQNEDTWVAKENYAYWQTPILLGYEPNESLQYQISFQPHPIYSKLCQFII